MFGKPEWFRPKTKGFGLKPITWQGWAYTSLWAATIALPFMLLIALGKPLEALTWMTLGGGALAYDVREILALSRKPASAAAVAVAPAQEDNVLYIMDDDQTHNRVAARGYKLQAR
jgi:hypothetical protein